jgi:hypothetical protein
VRSVGTAAAFFGHDTQIAASSRMSRRARPRNAPSFCRDVENTVPALIPSFAASGVPE